MFYTRTMSAVFSYVTYVLFLLQVRRHFFPKIPDPPKYPEKILFCGWRRDIDDMIMVICLHIIESCRLSFVWIINNAIEESEEEFS